MLYCIKGFGMGNKKTQNKIISLSALTNEQKSAPTQLKCGRVNIEQLSNKNCQLNSIHKVNNNTRTSTENTRKITD